MVRGDKNKNKKYHFPMCFWNLAFFSEEPDRRSKASFMPLLYISEKIPKTWQKNKNNFLKYDFFCF